MDNLLKKIFTDIISQEDDARKSDKYIDMEVQNIVDNYKETINAEELEELRGLLYQTALIAKQEGFTLGMKYMFRIMVSFLKDL